MKTHRKHSEKRGFRVPFVVLFLLVPLFVLSLYWDNNTIEIDEQVFASADLPAGFDGFRITQVSDLHEKQFGPQNRRLLAAVEKTDPDIIVITGDLIDRNGTIEDILPAVKGLAAIAPTYYVTGNHEWSAGFVPELMELLPKLGITCLANDYLLLQRGEDAIALAGVHDPNGFADQKTPAELADELHAALGDPFWILLAHRNSRYQEYGSLGADLILTGHSHGGLIRLPFIGGLVSPRHTLFPDWTAGFYEDFETPMFVSRGLGNTKPSFRIFNRAHLPVITLRCA